LSRLSKYQATVILYESPYRVKDTLQQIEKVVGERQIVIARELTKLHEEFIRGTATEILQDLQGVEVKGECCILIEGEREETRITETARSKKLTSKEPFEYYETEKEVTHKQAIKKVAVDRNVSRREIYEAIHVK